MRSNVFTLNDIRWEKKTELKRSGLANLRQNQGSSNRRKSNPLPQRPRQPPPRAPRSSDPGPGAAAALAPGTAIYNFLPPNLLEQLEVEINELVTLARLLKPAVVRLTEEVRKSI